MYNRYTPQQDGGFRRDRVPEASGSGTSRQHPSATQSPPSPAPAPLPHQPEPAFHNHPSSARGFLSGLLPRNMDTGDLLMLLILLLLLTDGSEDAPDPLLTIALFFLME